MSFRGCVRLNAAASRARAHWDRAGFASKEVHVTALRRIATATAVTGACLAMVTPSAAAIATTTRPSPTKPCAPAAAGRR